MTQHTVREMGLAMEQEHQPTDSRTDMPQAAPGKPILALFDFDGTITRCDSLLAFLQFYCGRRRFWLGLLSLSPWLVLYSLKLLANWQTKNAVLRVFLGGESVTAFQEKCDAFAQTVLPALVRTGALEAIRRYQAQGATIVVVSAAPENWLQPWCRVMGIECIATRLEVTHGKLSGRIAGLNCHGPEKVRRLLELYRPSAYAEIHAYGDSAGDRELLAMASQRYFKPFRN